MQHPGNSAGGTGSGGYFHHRVTHTVPLSSQPPPQLRPEPRGGRAFIDILTASILTWPESTYPHIYH